MSKKRNNKNSQVEEQLTTTKQQQQKKKTPANDNQVRKTLYKKLKTKKYHDLNEDL